MASAAPASVLTMGYEDKTLQTVLATLGEHEVDRVVDVRAIAESRVDDFSGDELAQALGADGIAYKHIGELGDFQPKPYPDYMQSEAFEAAYETLLSTVEQGTSCLICKCADASSCHRRYLAHRLRGEGHRVVHLTPAGPKEAVTFDAGP